MGATKFSILTVDPGSTSTKIGWFSDKEVVKTAVLRHPDADLAQFSGKPVIEQEEYRSQAVDALLGEWGCHEVILSAVVGRGGLLRPLASGTYRIDDVMLSELRQAVRGQHASNLGALLAWRVARWANAEAFVVDPVSVDEWPKIARYSGSALLTRRCLSHALNTKAVAKRHAKKIGRPYDTLRLIVAHMGSGISVSSHVGGRMVDVTNSREEGAFSTDRSGGVPSMELAKLCFSGRYSYNEIETLIFREGGVQSYLGTRDLMEVERRISDGDEGAAAVFEAMAYQIAKDIGSMAAVLSGRVDALLLTGGMAHSQLLLSLLNSMTGWIAPITAYPGEDELRAMAEGVLRVLRGEEPVRALENTHEDVDIRK